MKHTKTIFSTILAASLLAAPMAFAQSTQNGCGTMNTETGSTATTPANCGNNGSPSQALSGATTGPAGAMAPRSGLNAPNPDMAKGGAATNAPGSANSTMGAAGPAQ